MEWNIYVTNDLFVAFCWLSRMQHACSIFSKKITPSIVQKFLKNILDFTTRQTQHQMQCVPTQYYIACNICNIDTKQKHGTFHGTFKTEWMQKFRDALKSSKPFHCSVHISFDKFEKKFHVIHMQAMTLTKFRQTVAWHCLCRKPFTRLWKIFQWSNDMDAFFAFASLSTFWNYAG